MSSPRVSPADSPLFGPSFRRGLALAFVFALATLAHVESLSYWFASTDVFGLIESSRVFSLTDLVALFTEPLMNGTRFTEVGLFYRPVASLTYALDYAIWGLDPFGYHLTNLLLHGLAAVLVAIAVTALLDRPSVGYLSALLFAVHPLTAEVVPTAARRQDVLLTLFVLTSLALFARAHRRKSRVPLIGALFTYGLALGSKELAIVLPGVIAAWILFRPDRVAPRSDLPRSVGSAGSVTSLSSVGSNGVASADSDDVVPARSGETLASDGGYADDRSLSFDPLVRTRVISSLRAMMPFLAVTVAYLLARVAALGGLGGYEGGSLAAGDLLLIPLDYLLSITYQSNVLWASVGPSGRWSFVFVSAIALLGLAIDRYGARPTRLRSSAMIARLGFVYGLGLLAYVLVFGPELVRSFPAEFRYPWVVSVLVGACFVSGTLAGIASLLVARRPQANGSRSALSFLGIWLSLPVFLFYASGEFTMRSGYPFLAPAMAALSVLGIDAAREIRRHLRTDGDRRRDSNPRPSPGPGPGPGSDPRRSLGASVLVCCLVALLIVPQIAVSPLFHSYDGWETAGDVNQRTLTALDAATGREVGTTEPGRLVVRGLASSVDEQRHAFPRAESVGFLRENSIESWLRLASGKDIRVRVVDAGPIPTPPRAVSLSSTRNGAVTDITIRYDVASTDSSDDTDGSSDGAR